MFTLNFSSKRIILIVILSILILASILTVFFNTTNNSEDKDNKKYSTSLTSDMFEIEFKYNKVDKEISYDGYVSAINTCGELGEVSLEKENNVYILKYSINYNGEICGQAITRLDIEGISEIELNQAELDEFEDIFQVMETNN